MTKSENSKRRQSVFSFSDVEDGDSDAGFDFLPEKSSTVGESKPTQKQIKSLGKVNMNRNQNKLPEYPSTTINFSKLSSNMNSRKRIMNDRERFSFFIGNIIKMELKSIDKTYTGEFSNISKRLRQCWNYSSEEMETELTNYLNNGNIIFKDGNKNKNKKRKQNSKNLLLKKQEASLLHTINDLETQLEKWDQLVSKSKLEIKNKIETEMEKEAAMDENPNIIDTELEPCLKDMLDILKEKLSAAPKAIEIRTIETKQKLHEIKTNAKKTAQARTDLAKTFEKQVFAGYKNVNKPQKLIKFLIRPNN
eukprot:CAMPEP_0204823056 /NCGR_PEP_ID=MMETSP1346-20131115/1211_1 /ASSEMBLY_ACC=CAM_ASM_000771 /TAXON_ID=215587 /ORGANISM="Aplanochytrium stocchinoi, Strain GSBS06" /LENGTH=306 /DNA_ID=CAMNT_0051949589 /DNA_START=452 /DNA_END=1372 /DNA_ORIENTATION=-